MENWKDVPGYVGYKISDLGNMMTFWRRGGRGHKLLETGKLMKPQRHSIKNGGHYYVEFAYFNADGGRCYKTMGIHQAVLLAFVGPCPGGMEVCHRDRITSHNHLENLRYDTHTANMADKKIHGTELIGSRSLSAKLTEDTALEIRQLYAAGGITQQQLADKYNIGKTAIGELLLNHHWTNVDSVDPDVEPFDPEPETGDPIELSRRGIEIWRHIPNKYGYQISNLGNIRSRWRRGVRPIVLGPRWWIMKITKTKKDDKVVTMTVRLCPPGTKPGSYSIRLLVALAFIGTASDGFEATLLDGNPENCCLYNIKYSSRFEIMQLASARGALRERSSKLTQAQVLEIRRRADGGEIQRRLANEYGVSFTLISEIVNRNVWTHI